MRRLGILIGAASLVVGAAACGKKKAPVHPTPAAATAPAGGATTAPATSDTGKTPAAPAPSPGPGSATP